MTESWILKLNRAEQHLEEVESYVAAYAAAHPYFADKREHKSDANAAVGWVLRFTSEPDEMLPIVIGDLLHNVRSALDHLLIATLPRKLRRKPWASFPLFTTPPMDSSGEPLDTEEGQRWRKIAAAAPDAVTKQIEILQPYHGLADPILVAKTNAKGIAPTDIHGLALLNRLDNADKHRELVVLARGLSDPHVLYRSEDNEVLAEYDWPGMLPEGSELAHAEVIDPAKANLVSVEFRGNVRVAVEVRAGKGGVLIPDTLSGLIAHARDIAGVLGPFSKD